MDIRGQEVTNDDGANKIVSYGCSTGCTDRCRSRKLMSTRRLLIEIPIAEKKIHVYDRILYFHEITGA